MKQPSKKKKQSPAKRKRAAVVPVRGESIEQVDASGLYREVRAILDEARGHVARLVNVEMVRAYWLVGQAIVEQDQRGENHAGYGEQLIEESDEES